MEDEEPTIVETSTVSCDGAGGALGHPEVYLHVGSEAETVCPYCSHRFVLDGGSPNTDEHG